ncbi:uncharacterized protein EI90DRAFT_3126375 [Cantharellus anzutake]|uniref:uncharacterized protein n=1 Tax=Cantharellus anzutake TaxID=1750568 RepID=UPI0019033767|nr:uncharacterized protein EI90DRAFT_3126375 [Cantharellus anzutake]KAF8328202.1 hypothetical protein EI90DRAFT_3126375 [Cantharellus anzutake]
MHIIPDAPLLLLSDNLPIGYFAVQPPGLDVSKRPLDPEQTLAIAAIELGPVGVPSRRTRSTLDIMGHHRCRFQSYSSTEGNQYALQVGFGCHRSGLSSEAKGALKARGFPHGCHAVLKVVGNNKRLANDASRLSSHPPLRRIGSSDRQHTYFSGITLSKGAYKPNNISIEWR